MQVLLVEALIAVILVSTVIPTTTDKRVPPASAAFAIGFGPAAGVLLGGPVSGGPGTRLVAPQQPYQTKNLPGPARRVWSLCQARTTGNSCLAW